MMAEVAGTARFALSDLFDRSKRSFARPDRLRLYLNT